jgi:hypothetical protein
MAGRLARGPLPYESLTPTRRHLEEQSTLHATSSALGPHRACGGVPCHGGGCWCGAERAGRWTRAMLGGAMTMVSVTSPLILDRAVASDPKAHTALQSEAMEASDAGDGMTPVSATRQSTSVRAQASRGGVPTPSHYEEMDSFDAGAATVSSMCPLTLGHAQASRRGGSTPLQSESMEEFDAGETMAAANAIRPAGSGHA